MPKKTIQNCVTGEIIEAEMTAEEVAQLQADAAEEAAKQLARYRELRAAAFASEADPLFFQEQRGEVPTGTWLAKVEEIRLRYPSGGQA
jgi:hypothetical protein